jgi:hypothetical protein
VFSPPTCLSPSVKTLQNQELGIHVLHNFLLFAYHDIPGSCFMTAAQQQKRGQKRRHSHCGQSRQTEQVLISPKKSTSKMLLPISQNRPSEGGTANFPRVVIRQMSAFTEIHHSHAKRSQGCLQLGARDISSQLDWVCAWGRARLRIPAAAKDPCSCISWPLEAGIMA